MTKPVKYVAMALALLVAWRWYVNFDAAPEGINGDALTAMTAAALNAVADLTYRLAIDFFSSIINILTNFGGSSPSTATETQDRTTSLW